MAPLYVLLPAALLAFLCVQLFINWSTLRKAPGPALAGFTDLWRAYQQYNGRLRTKLVDLHARHGPIIRYGVRSISISDPEVINVVYGSRAGFITADSYKVLVGIQNGKEVPSLVSTRDEARHAALRRAVGNAFTPTAVLSYEHWVDATIAELLESVSRKTAFDLSSMVLWYTMDAAGRFSFGEPLGCLAGEDDVGGSIQLIRDRFNHWGWWSSIPWLERLVYRNPIAMRIKRAPSSMAAAAVAKLKARSAARGSEGGKADGDAHPDLLQRFLEASQDHPQALDGTGIVGILMSTISGAGDTTATTVTAALFNLLKKPEALKKLEAELTEAGVSEIPVFAEVDKLPYLNAVIKESMRVFTSVTWPMERLVPVGGATIAGMYFPEGTSVGCLPAAVHLNEKVYGADAGVFRPERWLAGDREQLRAMEAAHMGFSRGRRVCLGQHIAVLQMKKVIPALVMKFKLSLVDPGASLKADFSSAVACLDPLYVRSEIKP
ncbi:cytochrome P450 [Xylariaceae sp. FL1651]|nr:cytochrome P450 [Xylariaceae sp. FL1651]